MGFNLGGGLSGAGSGALAGAAFGPAGIGIGAVAGGLLGGLGGNGQTSQVPLETPEQLAARQKLMKFANTGTFGNFTAGANVPLGYGDFNTTGAENQGLSSLQQLLSGGIPSQYKMGDQALQDLLQTNPAAIQAQFDPFKAQVQRQINQSVTDQKRNAGYAGNLYSTDAIRNLGDIQAKGNETLTAQLASLTNDALNRRLQAIPLAYQSAQAQQDSQLKNIQASQTYGDLTRQLNDASIKARDAELLRRRQELQLPIQAAQTVAGGQTQFGVPSVSNPSPYQGVLNLASQLGGQYLGNQLSINQYKSAFPSTTSSYPSYTGNGTGMWG